MSVASGLTEALLVVPECCESSCELHRHCPTLFKVSSLPVKRVVKGASTCVHISCVMFAARQPADLHCDIIMLSGHGAFVKG